MAVVLGRGWDTTMMHCHLLATASLTGGRYGLLNTPK